MIEPTEADIGRTVIYKSNDGGKIEEGRIISINSRYIFVNYSKTGSTSAATARENLYWPTWGDDNNA